MVADSLNDQLLAAAEELIREEEDFHTRIRQMHLDQDSLNRDHDKLKASHKLTHDHARVRSAHEAMFKVHRKISREHVGITTYCQRIIDRLDRRDLETLNVPKELAYLRTVISRMKVERGLMESERKKILLEHQQFVNSISNHC